jgi:glycosidase
MIRCRRRLAVLRLGLLVSAVALLVAPSVNAADSATPPALSSFLGSGAVYETHPLYYAGAGNGKFATVTRQIPSLADLGVSTIYLQPFFAEPWDEPLSDSTRFGSRYTIASYDRIDPAYGSAADLHDLVATAHAHGMHVLFDLVLNHTCSARTLVRPQAHDCDFFRRGWVLHLTKDELAARAAPYPVVYTPPDTYGRTFALVNPRPDPQNCTSQNAVVTPVTCMKADFEGIVDPNGQTVWAYSYVDQGWGLAVDNADAGLVDYVTQVTERFLRDFGFDGWRVDAPENDFNPKFFPGDHSILPLLRHLRDVVVPIKPDFALVPETAWVDPRTFSNDLDEVAQASYDANYYLATMTTSGALPLGACAYGVCEPCVDGVACETYGAPDLLARIEQEGIQSGRTRLRYDETHDTPRVSLIAARLVKPLLVFDATISPGIPMIDAGQELGIATGTQQQTQAGQQVTTPITTPQQSVPEAGHTAEQRAMRGFYRKVLRARQRSAALTDGSMRSIRMATTGDPSKNYAYVRNAGDDQAVVLVNFGASTATDTVDTSSLQGTRWFDLLSESWIDVSGPVTVPAYGCLLLMPAHGDWPGWAHHMDATQ